MTDKKPLKLRPPSPTFDRVKIVLAIASYIALVEWSTPLHFSGSVFARLLYFFMVLEILRQFWVYRMEVSKGHVARARALQGSWDRQFRGRFDTHQRYRIRRFFTIIGGWYFLGWVIDGLTDRCDGAVQCALVFPRLFFENIPTILQVAIYIAIGMVQLFAMFYAMTKVGFMKILPPGSVDVSFDDVYGQDRARDRVREQVDLLENSEAIEAQGGYMPKGILLWGPPGTGKTMLARAAASASTKPLILIPPGGFASTFVGINFLKVHSLFRTVRKLGMRHDGVIVFIDEIDSLGNRGAEVADQMRDTSASISRACDAVFNADLPDPQLSDTHQMVVTGGSGGMGTLEAFLAGMDGMEDPRGLINKLLKILGFKPLPTPKIKALWFGATNVPTKIDRALTRAGRFGLMVHVPYPDKSGRQATYRGYIKKVNSVVTDDQIDWLSRHHHRGTGADIKDAVNESLLQAFREGRDAITFKDLIWAIRKKSFGESTGLMETDRAVRMVAVHEAGHAVASHYLDKGLTRIFIASIEKHGKTGGFVAPVPLSDDFIRTRTDMLNKIKVSLASRVVEELEFGEMSNGHGGDGPAATAVAAQMVALGHGNKIGSLNPLTQRDTSEYQDEVESILREAFDETYELLEPRMDQVRAVADLLMEHHTVDGDMIHNLLEEMEPSDA